MSKSMFGSPVLKSDTDVAILVTALLENRFQIHQVIPIPKRHW